MPEKVSKWNSRLINLNVAPTAKWILRDVTFRPKKQARSQNGSQKNCQHLQLDVKRKGKEKENQVGRTDLNLGLKMPHPLTKLEDLNYFRKGWKAVNWAMRQPLVFLQFAETGQPRWCQREGLPAAQSSVGARDRARLGLRGQRAKLSNSASHNPDSASTGG